MTQEVGVGVNKAVHALIISCLVNIIAWGVVGMLELVLT